MRCLEYSDSVTECRMVVARTWGKGAVGSCLMGAEFQLGKVKRVLWMDGGDGCTKMNHTLKNVYNGKDDR